MSKRELFYSIVEYLLAILFIQGGIKALFFSEPVLVPGLLAYLVGGTAIHAYGFLFLLMGVLLLIAKWFKRRILRRNVLMAMYLTCIYVLVLAITVNGWYPRLLLTIAAGVTSAGLWMRCKLKTENPNENTGRRRPTASRDT